jgi:tRNA A-37 threonylcarbamoyl transferase component Bud32
MADNWTETTALAALQGAQLASAGVVFRHDRWLYRTTGRFIAQGGVGVVHEVERRADGNGPIERVAAKTFHPHHLYQLRTDEVALRDHQLSLAALGRIAGLSHPGVMPTYVAAPLADNFINVTPLMGPTLLEAVHAQPLSPRARVRLLLSALEGLARLHQARILHRDFTLRNLLVDPKCSSASVFDFDLALAFDDIGTISYRAHYRGRLFGSPGYSVPPETLDSALIDTPIGCAIDVYAVGAALYGLFTDQLLYGPAVDMWGLLVRIADGIVSGGRSSVSYPPSVPQVMRPIIDRCLEREPAARWPSIAAVVKELGAALEALDDHGAAGGAARAATGADLSVRLASVFASRSDLAVTRAEIDTAEQAVSGWGYQLTRSLGRVKRRNIFMAEPRPDLVAAGQFPDANLFPKLVTVIDLRMVASARMMVENWQLRFFPTFKKVRRGLMTGLYNVIHDTRTNSLLLLSEFVDNPRFGTDLNAATLHVDGALALAFLVARQVAVLHAEGVAHNNIHAGALLFKVLAETGTVQPAMIGLIDPSLVASAMADDVRALATLMGSWLHPLRIAQLPKAAAAHVEALQRRLTRWAAGEKAAVDELVTAASDGLAAIDGNFAVLRGARGDLEAYTLLVVSHRLYHKLWRPS